MANTYNMGGYDDVVDAPAAAAAATTTTTTTTTNMPIPSAPPQTDEVPSGQITDAELVALIRTRADKLKKTYPSVHLGAITEEDQQKQGKRNHALDPIVSKKTKNRIHD